MVVEQRGKSPFHRPAEPSRILLRRPHQRDREPHPFGFVASRRWRTTYRFLRWSPRAEQHFLGMSGVECVLAETPADPYTLYYCRLALRVVKRLARLQTVLNMLLQQSGTLHRPG